MGKDIKFIIEKINIINLTINELKEHLKINNFNCSNVSDKNEYEFIKGLGLLNDFITIDLLRENIDNKSFDEFILNLKHALNNEKIYEVIWNKFGIKKNNCEKPKVVDLFCGAGGMSCGFAKAGYEIVFANDIEPVCINTFKINHPEVDSENVLLGDLEDIKKEILNNVTTDIDVVIGGPPCQGFSSANQQRIINDPRNRLYKSFIDVVGDLKPKFFVMENVRGMLKVADQVVEDFKSLSDSKNVSYDVSYKILNSYDFSVAQSRERLIYIGVRSDLKDVISPDLIFNNLERQKRKKYVLKDALEYIRPLKAETIKNQTNNYNEITGKLVDFNDYNVPNDSYINLINGLSHKSVIYNHKARYCNEINLEIYRRLDQGDDSTDEKIKDIMPYSNRNHLFKDKYFKLIEDRPSRTITAHLRMDCHSHIHPTQVRAITPREAARIQSFPDDYIFMGPYLKTYMQVGNAVPPLMAQAIAEEILKYL